MKDNWKELFDEIREEDILRNLPEDLPEMEDELAAKRIENKVLQELQKEKKSSWNGRRIAAAVVCCLIVVGAFGHEPIMAAFQKWFLDLPGAGVYIDENEETIYEVQIEPAVMEKDGIKVELKNFYAKDKRFYGEVFISGDLIVYDYDYDKKRSGIDQFEMLDEKYEITWFYGEKSRKMIDGSHGANTKNLDDGTSVCNWYRADCEEYLYLEDKGIDTYYLQVKGFDERFELKVVEPRKVASVEELGYSQTLNGNTITARAAIKEEGIELEYYRILTEEAQVLFDGHDRFEYAMIPNHFEQGYARRILNKNGEELRVLDAEQKMNGVSMLLEGTEEDFPLQFYFSGFSGTNDEEHTITLPIPEKRRKYTKNLPKVEFQYGTVQFLSVARTGTLEVAYEVVPKEGLRQMYAVGAEIETEEGGTLRGGHSWGMESGTMKGEFGFNIGNTEANSIQLILNHPSYWIEGEYNITIEKPMPKE